MTAWRPIKTAPRNGTRVQVKTEGGFVLEASWNADGYENEGGTCGGWEAAHEDKHPECWSDGVCWGSNADEVPSDQPEFWRPIVGLATPQPKETRA